MRLGLEMGVKPIHVVTAAEAVDLLQRLEPRLTADLNERRFQHTAALVGAEPTGVSGATMLYTWVDVALVRLVFVLEHQCGSRPVARAVVAMLWPQVRTLLERGRPIAAVIVVPIADKPPWLRQPPMLTTVGEARKRQLGGIHIALRDIATGIQDGVRDMRRRHETVRMWADVAPSTAATWLRDVRESAELTLV
jgi:hypothetical protein